MSIKKTVTKNIVTEYETSTGPLKDALLDAIICAELSYHTSEADCMETWAAFKKAAEKAINELKEYIQENE